MNSFDNSDQADFDAILENTARIGQSVDQNTGILSRIQEGVGAVGNGIANIYRNNKEDYGINMPQVRQNVATMAGGPLAAVLQDALSNVGLDIGSIVKSSIGGIMDKFHGHSDNFENGDIAGDLEPMVRKQVQQGDEQIELHKKAIGSGSRDTDRKIQADGINTQRILNKMDDLGNELTGTQSKRTGKRGAGIGGGGSSSNNVQVLGGGSLGNGSTQSLNQIANMLGGILRNQGALNSLFTDPNADKGGWMSIIKEFGGMWKGLKFWLNGRYAKDIPRSANPLETMTNALIKIYEWERIGIDLSRRQLNEIIKSTGGVPQKYVGHEGALKTYLKKKTNELKNAIDSKYGADSFTGKNLKRIVSVASFFARFTDEDFKDDRFAQAHNALDSMGKRKSQHLGKTELYDDTQVRKYLNVLGADVSQDTIEEMKNSLFAELKGQRLNAIKKIQEDPEVQDQIKAFNKINQTMVGTVREDALKQAFENLSKTIKTKQEQLGISGLHNEPLNIALKTKSFGRGLDTSTIDSSKTYTAQDIIQDPAQQFIAEEGAKLEEVEKELKNQMEFLRTTGQFNLSGKSLDELIKTYKILKGNQQSRAKAENGGTLARIGDSVIPVTIINPSAKIAAQIRKSIGGGLNVNSVQFSNQILGSLNRLAILMGGDGNSLAEEIVYALEASKVGVAVRNIHDEDYDHAELDLDKDILDAIHSERANNGNIDASSIANSIIQADQNTNVQNLRGQETVEGQQLAAEQKQADILEDLYKLMAEKGVLTDKGNGNGFGIFDIFKHFGSIGDLLKTLTIVGGGLWALNKFFSGFGDTNSKGEKKDINGVVDYALDKPATTVAQVASLTGHKVVATGADIVDYNLRDHKVNETGRASNQAEAALAEWTTPFGLGGAALNATTIAGDMVENATGSSAAGDATANAGRAGVNVLIGKSTGAIAGKAMQYGGDAIAKSALLMTHLGSKVGNGTVAGKVFDVGAKLSSNASKAAVLKAAGPILQGATGALDAWNRYQNGDVLGSEIAAAGAAGGILAMYAFGGPAAWVVAGLTIAALYANDLHNETYVDDMNAALTDEDFLNTEDNSKTIQKIMIDEKLSDLQKAKKIAELYNNSYQGATREKSLEAAFNDKEFMDQFSVEIKKAEKDAGDIKGLNGAQQKKYSEFIVRKLYDYYKSQKEKQKKLVELQEKVKTAYSDNEFKTRYSVEIANIVEGINSGKLDQEQAMWELSALYDSYLQVYGLINNRNNGDISAKDLLEGILDYGPVSKEQDPYTYDEDLAKILEEYSSGKHDPKELEQKILEWQKKRDEQSKRVKAIIEQEKQNSQAEGGTQKFAGGAEVSSTTLGISSDGTPFQMGEKDKEYLIPANDSIEGRQTMDKIARGLAKNINKKKFGSFATGAVSQEGSIKGLDNDGIGSFAQYVADATQPYLAGSEYLSYLKGTDGTISLAQNSMKELKEVTEKSMDRLEETVEPIADGIKEEAQNVKKKITPSVEKLDKNVKDIADYIKELKLNADSVDKPDYYQRDENGNIKKDEKGNPVIDEEKFKEFTQRRNKFVEGLKKEEEKDIFDITYLDSEEEFQKTLKTVKNPKRVQQLIEGRARVLDAKATQEKSRQLAENQPYFVGPVMDEEQKEKLRKEQEFTGPQKPTTDQQPESKTPNEAAKKAQEEKSKDNGGVKELAPGEHERILKEHDGIDPNLFVGPKFGEEDAVEPTTQVDVAENRSDAIQTEAKAQLPPGKITKDDLAEAIAGHETRKLSDYYKADVVLPKKGTPEYEEMKAKWMEEQVKKSIPEQANDEFKKQATEALEKRFELIHGESMPTADPNSDNPQMDMDDEALWMEAHMSPELKKQYKIQLALDKTPKELKEKGFIFNGQEGYIDDITKTASYKPNYYNPETGEKIDGEVFEGGTSLAYALSGQDKKNTVLMSDRYRSQLLQDAIGGAYGIKGIDKPDMKPKAPSKVGSKVKDVDTGAKELTPAEAAVTAVVKNQKSKNAVTPIASDVTKPQVGTEVEGSEQQNVVDSSDKKTQVVNAEAKKQLTQFEQSGLDFLKKKDGNFAEAQMELVKLYKKQNNKTELDHTDFDRINAAMRFAYHEYELSTKKKDESGLDWNAKYDIFKKERDKRVSEDKATFSESLLRFKKGPSDEFMKNLNEGNFIDPVTGKSDSFGTLWSGSKDGVGTLQDDGEHHYSLSDYDGNIFVSYSSKDKEGKSKEIYKKISELSDKELMNGYNAASKTGSKYLKYLAAEAFSRKLVTEDELKKNEKLTNWSETFQKYYGGKDATTELKEDYYDEQMGEVDDYVASLGIKGESKQKQETPATPKEAASDIQTPQVGTEVEGTPQSNVVDVSDKKTEAIKSSAKSVGDLSSVESIVKQIKSLNPEADVNKEAIKHYGIQKIQKEPWLATLDKVEFDDPDSEEEAKDTWDLETKAQQVRKQSGAKSGDKVEATLVGGQVVDSKVTPKQEPQVQPTESVEVPTTPTEAVKDIQTPQVGTEVEGSVQLNPVSVSEQASAVAKDTGTSQVKSQSDMVKLNGVQVPRYFTDILQEKKTSVSNDEIAEIEDYLLKQQKGSGAISPILSVYGTALGLSGEKYFEATKKIDALAKKANVSVARRRGLIAVAKMHYQLAYGKSSGQLKTSKQKTANGSISRTEGTIKHIDEYTSSPTEAAVAVSKENEIDALKKEILELNPQADINDEAINYFGVDKVRKSPWLATVDFPEDPDDVEEAKDTWDLETKASQVKNAAGVSSAEQSFGVQGTLVGGQVTEAKRTDGKTPTEAVKDIVSGATQKQQTPTPVESAPKESVVKEPTPTTPTEAVKDIVSGATQKPQTPTPVESKPIDAAKQAKEEGLRTIEINGQGFKFKTNVTSVDQIKHENPVVQEYLRMMFQSGEQGIDANTAQHAWKAYAKQKKYEDLPYQIRDIGEVYNKSGFWTSYEKNVKQNKQKFNESARDVVQRTANTGISDDLKQMVTQINTTEAKNISAKQLAEDFAYSSKDSPTFTGAYEAHEKSLAAGAGKGLSPLEMAKLSQYVNHDNFNEFYDKRKSYAKSMEGNKEFETYRLADFDKQKKEYETTGRNAWLFNPEENWKEYFKEHGIDPKKDKDVLASHAIVQRAEEIRKQLQSKAAPEVTPVTATTGEIKAPQVSSYTPEFSTSPRSTALNTAGMQQVTSTKTQEHATEAIQSKLDSTSNNMIASTMSLSNKINKGGSVTNNNTTINNNPDTHYLQAMGLPSANPCSVV